ncbi:MAG: PKD domain-containing protein [Planctomycetes bacterium]|nr:PKD domain-containing protein [Planctomycetota bacterium]
MERKILRVQIKGFRKFGEVAAFTLVLPLLSWAEEPRYVEWMGYLGGSGDDIVYGVATGADGSIYVAGSTNSWDFGLTAGWNDVSLAGWMDAFVVKLAPDASRILALATLGGPGADSALAVRVAPDGAVIVGGTVEPDFFPDIGDCGSEVQGPSDVFVTRFDGDLNLLAFQLIGGSRVESLRDLQVATDGTIFLLGFTSSSDLLSRWGGSALQPGYGGGSYDLFLARLKLQQGLPCTDRLLYLSYLGGTSAEADPGGAPFPGALRAGADGVATITGHTASGASFPRKPGGYLSPSRGGWDAFVLKIRCDATLPPGDQLLSSAMVGGSDYEGANGLEVAEDGRVVVAGFTWSGNFPVTDGSSLSGGNDIFVAVLDPDLSRLSYATLIGGSQPEPPTAALLKSGDSLILGGITVSPNFPVTPEALGSFTGIPQAYLLEWSLDGARARRDRLRFSTPLTSGGACAELLQCNRLIDMTVSRAGSVIACGVASSPLLVVAGDPAQLEPAGGADVFLASFDLRRPEANFIATAGTDPESANLDAAASTTPTGTSIVSYLWDFGDGATAEGMLVSHAYGAPGRYCPKLTVENDLGFISAKTLCIDLPCAAGDTSPYIQSPVGAAEFPSSALWDGTAPSTRMALCAGGRDIGGQVDSFFFVHREFDCDGVLTGRFADISVSAVGSKLGLMVREDLDPGSRHAAILLQRGFNDFTLRWLVRKTSGETTSSMTAATVPVPPDAWLRIERKGDQISGSFSTDGKIWSPLGEETLPGLSQFGVAAAGKEPLSGVRFTPFQARVELLDIEPCGPPEPRFLRGDSNADGKVDISDPIVTLGFLFLGNPVLLACRDAADANDDGMVDMSDAIWTLTFKFLGAVEIPAPGPDSCGVDPTPDDPEELTCESFAPCLLR